MKRYLFVLIICLCGFASCSKSDHEVPKLNKLTRVICYKNGEQNLHFTVNINYKSDGQIATVQYNDEKQQYIYVGNTITVSGTDPVSVEYGVRNNLVVSKSVSRKNPYSSSVVYVSDEYTYNYNKASQVSNDWVTRWPLDNGTEYETRTYRSAQTFQWESGNMVRYTEDKKEMAYEYDALMRPENFPFRVINTFSPVDFDIIHPVNLFYGTQNRLLPRKAYWYNIPETSVVCAEYLFNYSFTSEYVTGMIIEEKNYINEEVGNNTYEYVLEYNFIDK